jgi:metal-responsive CopG/Arc/MetJ family transcriptional regulator
VSRNDSKGRRELLLVEFKAPKELVAAFDAMLKSRFSNRSEAIRSLMRAFVEAATKKS